MIMVQSTFQLHPESRDEALGLMKNMVRLCRQEHGCLGYEYFAGITNPNQVVLLQEWENADSLEEHYQTAHMEDFLNKLGQFLSSPVSTRSYVAQEEHAGSGKVGKQKQLSDELAKPEQTIH
ncbi:MAG: putative quinol monooxygenase [Pseudohongiellaceae bacterium]